MSYTLAKDISQYQGNWQDTDEPIVMIKCGGGDQGIYFDPDCTQDYDGAAADNRAPGLYWYIGWVLGAEQEAAAFVRGIKPFSEGDVYALDIEKGVNAIPDNAVQYVTDMVNYIKANTYGTNPLLYMSLSTLNAYDWSSLLTECGLWLADWAVSPDANIPTNHSYIMQQYSDGPNYDHDEWFDTVAVFKEYGVKIPSPAPPPAPPETPPTPVEAPPEPGQGSEQTTNTPVVTETPTTIETTTTDGPTTTTTVEPKPIVIDPSNWLEKVISWIKKLFKRRQS